MKKKMISLMVELLDSSKQTEEESNTEDDDNKLDLDLGMPEHIVRRRN